MFVGKYFSANGNIYDGGWKAGVKHGKAKFFMSGSGKWYDYIFEDGNIK